MGSDKNMASPRPVPAWRQVEDKTRRGVGHHHGAVRKQEAMRALLGPGPLLGEQCGARTLDLSVNLNERDLPGSDQIAFRLLAAGRAPDGHMAG